MSRSRRSALALALLVACGCAGSTSKDVPSFTEVAAAAGVDFEHRSDASERYALPEIMGGGVGFLDHDGDGRLDLYLVQSGGGTGNALFRNRGDGSFEDVSAAAGVDDRGYGMGCATGDYDNDGRVDLYVTNLGNNVLYRNMGNGRFENRTKIAGVGDPGWSTSATFLDYDADGDLDLFVANYVDWGKDPAFAEKACHATSGARDYCSPQSYAAPARDTLYRNEGDGRFTDVTVECGLAAKSGTGLGAVATDLDGDGSLDIYVANDQMPSFAWLQVEAGHFVERAVPLGIAVDERGQSQAGMGVALGDVDSDGDLDLWKVHLHRESHVLYLNRGGFFDDATARLGLAAPTRRYTGFGTGFLDFDRDGRLDLFVGNGRVQYVAEVIDGSSDDPFAEPNQLLRQRDDGRFEDVTADSGPALRLSATSRGAAFGDYDNDGDIDIAVVNRDAALHLLRNDVQPHGNSLTLRVLDRHGRDALGARLTVVVEEISRAFQVESASSYCAAGDPRVHVGLGAATRVDRVDVLWREGGHSTHGPFPAGFATIRAPGRE